MGSSSVLPVLPPATADAPAQADLDRCVHCGLCLNACPTYRELGLEMDSPRGRIYQMNQVANGAPITESYIEHIDRCLACRGCETACPSGVAYGRLVEAARAQIELVRPRRLSSRIVRAFVFNRLLPSYGLQKVAGAMLFAYQASGLQRVLRRSRILRLSSRLARLEALTPAAERPFFYDQIGRTFPPEGPRRYRVAFLAGCIANISFARLNEATIRVLQKNGCEVHVPSGQNCCGALHVHAGAIGRARGLARQNVKVFLQGEYDAILTNTAGCGSTLKEYGHLLANDTKVAASAQQFQSLVRDVNEFLASIGLNRELGPLSQTVTYQDSCHLAHGQKIRSAPRQLLGAIPGLTLREMPGADLCCGSAGIYNVLEDEMAAQILAHKMESVNGTRAAVIATANPGCILQLRAGVAQFGRGQRVAHVIELLDEAYRVRS